jgi:hypothetical protein
MWGHVLMFRNRQVLGGSKFMKKRDPMVEYAYTLQIASNTWQPKPNFKAIEEIFLVYLEGTLYLWISLVGKRNENHHLLQVWLISTFVNKGSGTIFPLFFKKKWSWKSIFSHTLQSQSPTQNGISLGPSILK